MPVSGLHSDILENATNQLMKITENLELIKVEQSIENLSEINFDKIEELYNEIVVCSNTFYELIPHKNFSYSKIEPLVEIKKVNAKIQLIHDLNEISTAKKIIFAANYNYPSKNPIDYSFRATNTQFEVIPPHSEEYKALFDYANISKTSSYKMNIFKIQRQGEPERLIKNLSNHYLLWHGSKVSNYLAILSEGLRVAPVYASNTGYLFGKGIYFADMLDKSIAYCDSSPNGNKYVLLCEVALGVMKELYEPEYMESAPEGYNSCKAIGTQSPDFTRSLSLPNGVIIPGPMIDPTKINQSQTEARKKITRDYNEYIVYNNSQVRLRYLIQIVAK